MSTKAIKMLKTGWSQVAKKGGNFALAMNGYPSNARALPLLMVDRRKVLEKKNIAKLDKDADLSKVIHGRISVEDGRLAFNISPASKVKSPAMLKKAIRQLAKHDDAKGIKLASAVKAHFRMDTAMAMDGDATLDTAEQAQQRGGKAKKKILGRSRFAQLIGALSEWERKHRTSLSASSIGDAEALLSKISQRARSWMEKNEGDRSKSDRKAEVQRIQRELAAAQHHIDTFKRTLAENDDVDDLVDELLAEDADAPDPAILQRVQTNLSARLKETLDEDERAELLDQLKQLGQKAEAGLRQARQRAEDGDLADKQVLWDTQDSVSRGRLAEVEEHLLDPEAVKQLSRDDLKRYRKTRSKLRGRSEDSLDEMVDQLSGDDLRGQDAYKMMGRLTESLVSLERIGARGMIRRYEKKLTELSSQMTVEQLTSDGEDVTDIEAFNNRLGRGNNPDSKVRAETVKHLGREYVDSLQREAIEEMGENLNRPISGLNELPEMDAVYGIKDRMQAIREEARDALAQRALARGAEHGLTLDRILGWLSGTFPTLSLEPGREPAPLPSVSDILAALLPDLPEQEETDEDRQAQEAARERMDAAVQLREDELPGALARLSEAGEETLGVIRRIFVRCMDRILGSPGAIPAPIRQLCVAAFDGVKEIPVVTDRGARNLLNDILVLRWLGPAMGQELKMPDPDSGALVPIPTMGGVSQLAISVANGTVPQGTLFLPLLDLLSAYAPRYQDFLTAILEQTREELAGERMPDGPEGRSEDYLDRVQRQRQEKLAEISRAEVITPREGWMLILNELTQRCGGAAGNHRRTFIVDQGALKPALYKPAELEYRRRVALLDAPDRAAMLDIGGELVREALARLDELLEEARNGTSNAVFTVRDEDDEDESYDLDEHWRMVMQPWMIGRLNAALSSHPDVDVNDMAAVQRDVFGDIKTEHARIFDPLVHRELPRKIAKADQTIQPLLTQIESSLSDAIQQVAESRQDTDAFQFIGPDFTEQELQHRVDADAFDLQVAALLERTDGLDEIEPGAEGAVTIEALIASLTTLREAIVTARNA